MPTLPSTLRRAPARAAGRPAAGAPAGAGAPPPRSPAEQRATAHRRRRRIRRIAVVAGGLVLLVAGGLASLALGSLAVPLHEVLDAVRGRLGAENVNREVILGLRLPRTVVAAIVGGALGASGGLLQGALGNPLAAPDIVGVTAGAGFGAMLIILVFPGSISLVPLVALLGGLVASGLVFAVAWAGRGGGNVARIILAGIAVGALFTAATTALLSIHPERAQSGVFFLAGNLTFDGWRTLEVTWPYLAGAALVAAFVLRPLDRLALGDDVARALGGRPGLVRLVAAAAAAVRAAAAAAMAGLLGFLGLIVPHVVRLAGGTSRSTFLVPASAIVGAGLLVVADVLARTVAPMELPVGPLVVAVGVPVFLWLLHREA